MARIKKGSRRMALVAAFVGVMSGAGAFAGAITGAVFVLLLRYIFNMSSGIPEFMISVIVLGTLVSAVFGLMLTVELPQRMLEKMRKSVTPVTPVPVPAVRPATDGK